MEEQVDKVQKQGQDFYREKNYEAALDCFNSIIARYIDVPLSVWDNRAAVYTKLGNTQAALRDGKQMIHTAKAEATGYLRTGQVLRLMGKEDVAIDIYKYGLRNVSTSHADFELLRCTYKKILDKFMPPKAIDPLLILPLEIAEMMFQYLDFNNLVILLRVSRSWKQLIESLPALWHHLDLSSASKKVTKNAIRACVRRANGSIRRVTLCRWASDRPADIIRHITSHCKGLEYLEIRDGLNCRPLFKVLPLAARMSTLILGPDHAVSFDTVTLLLAHCHSLERAEFHGIAAIGEFLSAKSLWKGDLSKLRVLKMCGDQGSPRLFNDLNRLLQKTPNLRQLTLKGWDNDRRDVVDFSLLTHLESLDIVAFMFEYLPPLPSSLRSLHLGDCSYMDFSDERSQFSIAAANLGNLQAFSISGDPLKFAFRDMETLLQPSISKLKRLVFRNLQRCSSVGNDDYGIYELLSAGHFQDLRYLDLSRSTAVGKTGEMIATKFPSLVYLDLSYTPVSGVGVKALVMKEGEKLEKLVLQHCKNVSVDAVDYARAMGVNVVYNFPENVKYRKKVRHGA